MQQEHSSLSSCIFVFLDLPNITDFLCGGSRKKSDIPHFIVYWRYFLFVLMHCSLEEICSNLLSFPSRVQQDSFTFATGKLHTLRIYLGANTLTCKVLVTSLVVV